MTAPTLPARRRPLLRLIVDSNPLFLLSAALMFLAARLISAELAESQSRMGSSLFLLGMLNFYELLLIALGLFLRRRPASRRDGNILLIMEAFFLADFSFINSELFTVGGWLPIAISIAVILAAAAKIYFILRGLELGLDRFGLNVFVFVELAVLMLLPGFFGRMAAHHEGALPLGAIYLAWWIAAGLLWAMAKLWKGEHSGIARLYLLVPLISLVAHLGLTNWVYWQTFMPGNISPMLLVFALLLKRLRPTRFIPTVNVRFLQAALPVLACMLTFADWTPPVMIVSLHSQRFALTSISLTLAAAYVTVVWCLAERYALLLLTSAAAAVGIYLFGPTWEHIEATALNTSTRVVAFLGKLIPRTLTQWGLTSAAASFALLGIGTAASARKRVATTLSPDDD